VRPSPSAPPAIFVRDVLREQPRETAEAAELMTSELATNAVRHAHSDFELAIHCSQRDIRIEVSDSGQDQPTLRSPMPHERSGRGLRIVQEPSDTWGTVPSTNGKMGVFTLPTQTFAMEREPRSAARSDEVSGPGARDAGLLGSAGLRDPKSLGGGPSTVELTATLVYVWTASHADYVRGVRHGHLKRTR
jgi:hypothetical protein